MPSRSVIAVCCLLAVVIGTYRKQEHLLAQLPSGISSVSSAPHSSEPLVDEEVKAFFQQILTQDPSLHVSSLPRVPGNLPAAAVTNTSSSSLPLTTSSFVPTQTTFPDVNGATLEGRAANTLLARGVITGKNGRFAAADTLTRAELVTMIMRSKQGSIPTNASTFRDIEPNAWYAVPVAWAAEQKIVTGYSDGTFQPNRAVSRAEFAAIAVRAYALTQQEGPSLQLVDIASNQWYAEPVKNAVSNGLFSDVSLAFRPLQFASRSTAAIGICRAMGEC